MSNEINGLPGKAPATNTNSSHTAPANVSRNNASDPQKSGSQTASIVSPSSDSLTLTRQAENLITLEASVNEQSGIDSGRVEDLKLAIDAGQFNIDPLRVAEKFIQFETQFLA